VSQVILRDRRFDSCHDISV